MIIQIPDEVALRYQEAADRARVPVTKILERQLLRFADIPAGSRAVTLHGDALQEVDQLLGIGSTLTAGTLLGAIKAWAGITIGDVRLQFSPAQLAEIAHRADKQGKTPTAVVADIVEQMNRNFFEDAVVLR